MSTSTTDVATGITVSIFSTISNSSSISTTEGNDITSSSKSISSSGASSKACAQTEQTFATGSFILKHVTQILAFLGCQIQG